MSDDELYPAIPDDDDDDREEGMEHVQQQNRRASNSNVRRSVTPQILSVDRVNREMRSSTPESHHSHHSTFSRDHRTSEHSRQDSQPYDTHRTTDTIYTQHGSDEEEEEDSRPSSRIDSRPSSRASMTSQRKSSMIEQPVSIPEISAEEIHIPSAVSIEIETTSITQALLDHYASIGYYSHMKKIAESALSKDPSNKIWIFWQAFALSKEGDQSMAIKLLDPYQNDTDLGLPAVALLITAHNKMKHKDRKAMYALKKSLKTASRQTNMSSLTLAARYFLHIHKINKSRQCIEKLLSRNKKNIILLTLFGWIYIRSGVDDYFIRSLSIFKKALTLSCDKPDVAALMGRAKFMEIEKSWDKAIADLELIISLYPDFIPAYEEKSRLLLQSGSGKEALLLATTCITKYQSLVGQHIVTLCILLLEGDATKGLYAVKQLVAALDREELTNAELYYNTSRIVARLAKHDQSIIQVAQVILKYAMKLEPRYAPYMIEMGYQHLLLGNYHEGSIVFRESYILDPDEIHGIIGQVVAKCMKHEWEEASQQVKEMPEKLQQSDDSMLLYCRAAICWNKEKSKSKAAEILLDAIEKHLQHLKDEPMGDQYYCDLHPDLLCDMTKLFLSIMGETSTATGTFRDCLEYLTTGLTHLTALVPGYVEAHLLLAKLKVLSKDLVGVEAAVEAALAIAPSHPEALAFSSRIRSGNDLHHFSMDHIESTPSSIEIKTSPPIDEQRIQESKEKARKAINEFTKRSEPKVTKKEEEEEEDDFFGDDKDLELTLNDVDDDMNEEERKKHELEADQEFQKTMKELEEKAEADRITKEATRLKNKEIQEQSRTTQQQKIDEKAEMVAKEALYDGGGGMTRGEAIKKKQEIEIMRKQREKELELYKAEIHTQERQRAFIPSADSDALRIAITPTSIKSNDELSPKTISPVGDGMIAISRDTTPPIHEFFSDSPLQLQHSSRNSMSSQRSSSPAPELSPTTRRMSEESKQMLDKKNKIMLAGQQIEMAKAFCKAAYWGELFKKHGRRGRPHDRNVTLEVDQNILKLDWSSGQLKAAKNDIQILEGKQTQVFARSASSAAPAEHCFSIVTANRSLDLEARNVKVKEFWVQGLNYLIKYLK